VGDIINLLREKAEFVNIRSEDNLSPDGVPPLLPRPRNLWVTGRVTTGLE
jgi:hypothetical protein